MQDGMEQEKPGFRTRAVLERFEHVRDASFTSDGKGLWAPATETAPSLWDAETGRIIFAPALPETAISPASAITDDAPATGLAQSRILFRGEQARTFAETATALMDRNRSPSFKWSLEVASRADPPKPPDWRAAMPYRFLLAPDEKLLLIEQVKDYLPEGLLVDLETGEEIARIKAGQISVSGDAARFGAGVWFSGSHPGSRPRALFITAESVRDARAATGSEITSLLPSGDHGVLFLGTSQGELLACRRGSPAPVLTLRIAEGPVKTISRGAERRLIIEAEGAVSFLLPDGTGAKLQTHPGRVGDISADGTLTAVMTPASLSILETVTGTVAWSVGKPFDRILFSCDGSSVYCMMSKDRTQTLEEFDSLAGFPLDPPSDRSFKRMLAAQRLRRFGQDEYITACPRPNPFIWLSGAKREAETSFRGFPGKNFNGNYETLFFPAEYEKTCVLIEGQQPSISLRNGYSKPVSFRGMKAPGDLDIVFVAEDGLVIISSVEGEIQCHRTLSGELQWQLFSPLGISAGDIRRVPCRSESSALLLDSHLNVLDPVCPDLSTLEALPDNLCYAELSADGAEIARLTGHTGKANSAEFNPDGTLVMTTCSNDPGAHIWSTLSGAPATRRRGGHRNEVRYASFSPNGRRVVTASVDGTAHIWDAATGGKVTRLSGHKNGVTSTVFNPDGTRVVTASWDKTARIWDAASGAEIICMTGHTDVVNTAVFSPDGLWILTASRDRTARVWDAATGAELTCLSRHEDCVNGAAFSPDGLWIVTASRDKTARIWDAASGAEIANLGGHMNGINSVAFSPDGARIVTAQSSTAHIWDWATGREIQRLNGHEGEVNAATFSTDGTRIVTASSDRTARIWNSGFASRVLTLGLDGAVSLWSTTDGRCVSELKGKTAIRQARFSSCGRFFATADAEGLLSLCSSQGGDTLWQVRTGHRYIRAVFPLPGDDGIRILVGSHIETWHREPGAGKSSGHQRVSSVLSVNGWPLRFVTDLTSLLDLDEKTLAGISSNGIAYDSMRSRVLHDDQKRPLTLHVPYGPLRAVHRKLKPGLEELRAQELGQADLPVWRNAATAFAAHAGAPVTVSLRIGAYAEPLSFGRVLAWMKSGPLQMGDDAATLLSRILTRSDHLAIQTRTAALLGELMTIDLTTRLAALGRDQGVNVTRFSDRIFISGEDIPAGIGSFARTHREDIFVPGRLLSQAVSRSGFRLEAYGEVRGRVSEPA
jgi:WD40 repeat protein